MAKVSNPELQALPPSLEFSSNFVAEYNTDANWEIFRLDTIGQYYTDSGVFYVATRENAKSLMARLDQIEDAKKVTV